MAFSIHSFEADPAGNIVSVNWRYTNADGSLGDTHVLATPAGDVPLEGVTQDTLLGWLNDQLENTASDFDAQLADVKLYLDDVQAEADYQDSLTRYNLTSSNQYTADDE